MRPEVVAWLVRHALPTWLAPDYAVLVGIAGIVGAIVAVRLAERDRAALSVETRAIAIGYVAALAGGYVLEWIRAVPTALADGSFDPIVGAGRAAYGGLLGGLAAATSYVRWKRQPILPFLDRLTVVLGIAFALVRLGCFLAGCDFGRPTASPLGVRFPPESLAAIEHAARGWVPIGARSLPVHPTQLYEAALGVVATAAAWCWRRRGHRDGRAIATWLAVYAIGRFAIETLRGDADRGVYVGLSSAQYISIALIVAALVLARRALRGPPLAALASLVVIASIPCTLHAQEVTVATPRAPDASPPPPPPPPVPMVTLRATVAPGITLARPDVPSGGVVEVSGRYRLPLSAHDRFEIGLEGRLFASTEADHYGLGVPFELDFGFSRRVEMLVAIVPTYNWIVFKSPYFRGTNAWSARLELGIQGRLGSRFLLGGSPLSFHVLSAETTGVITTWEPRLWFGVEL